MSMALSDPNDVLVKTTTDEMDILGASYYKLPFCDEDINQFGDGIDDADDWVNSMLEDRFVHGTGEMFSPCSPSSYSGALSPSSTSSGSSSGIGSHEHAYSLITDRPDTPLTAVKFEDFSNGFPIGGLPNIVKEEYDPSLAFDSDLNLQNNDELNDLAMSFDNHIVNQKNNRMDQGSLHDVSITATDTLDKCLSSTIDSLGSNVITISKLGNTVQVKKETDMSMDYSTTGTTTFDSSLKSNVINITADGKIEGVSTPVYLTSNSQTVNTNSGSSVSQHTAKVTKNAVTQRTQIQIPTSTLQTILKSGRLITKLRQDGQYPRIKIKTEPCEGEQYVRICQPQVDVQLPPTPPSSNTSDSEGSLSPNLSCTRITPEITVPSQSHIQFLPTTNHISAQLLTNPQRLTQTHGELHLTEEEKRTLVTEGYAVPDKLPLTKGEEKALKKIRRKIKNKISAQESRRKKKEYVEALERRMESFNQENGDLRRKLDSLEDSNQSLMEQLRALQMLVAEKLPRQTNTVTTQTSSCLMVVVLCFAVFLGGWLPFLTPFMTGSQSQMPYHQSMDVSKTWRSRVLLSYADEAWRADDFCDIEGCFDNPVFDIGDGSFADTVIATDDGSDQDVIEGGDTYDEPASGRVVMNDTKDQLGQVIANTMEPRDVAAILASSRKMPQDERKIDMAAVEIVSQDNRKFAPPSPLVAE